MNRQGLRPSRETRERIRKLEAEVTRLRNDAATVESAVEKEQGRWQEAIYEVCCKRAPGANIDGAGCDSGDPLDLTLTEIGQALNWIEEHAHTSNEKLTDRREKN